LLPLISVLYFTPSLLHSFARRFFTGGMTPPKFLPWPTRQVRSAKPNSDQLFPLPMPLFRPGGQGNAKRARRRAGVRIAAHDQAVQTQAALNALFGCTSSAVPSESTSPAQSSVLSHIMQRSKDFVQGHVQTPRESFHEILGSRTDYGGAPTSVESYDPDRVSLPTNQVKPVALSALLRSDLRDFLQLDNILADEDGDPLRGGGEGDSQCYMDVVLRSNKILFLGFLRRLFDCGILGFSTRSRGRITPFLYERKVRSRG